MKFAKEQRPNKAIQAELESTVFIEITWGCEG